jgi:hypothetical protein
VLNNYTWMHIYVLDNLFVVFDALYTMHLYLILLEIINKYHTNFFLYLQQQQQPSLLLLSKLG